MRCSACATSPRARSCDAGPPFEPGGDTAWVAPARTTAGEERCSRSATGTRRPSTRPTCFAPVGRSGGSPAAPVRAPRRHDLVPPRALRPGHPAPGAARTRADEVLAEVLRRIWSTPLDATPFRPLHDLCRIWADETEERAEQRPEVVDPASSARARGAASTASDRRAARRNLLCTDLHAGNVLAAAASRGCSSTRSPTSESAPTTSSSICSTAPTGSSRTARPHRADGVVVRRARRRRRAALDVRPLPDRGSGGGRTCCRSSTRSLPDGAGAVARVGRRSVRFPPAGCRRRGADCCP